MLPHMWLLRPGNVLSLLLLLEDICMNLGKISLVSISRIIQRIGSTHNELLLEQKIEKSELEQIQSESWEILLSIRSFLV
jgi:hypothetical protein